MSSIVRAEDVVLSVEAAHDLIARCLEVRDFTALIEAQARARAVETYTRGRRASLHHQNTAAELALRFERALGQLCKELPKNPGTRYGGSRPEPPDADGGSQLKPPPTLADLGITKKESHRWQKLADIAPDVFEAHLEVVKAKGEKLTTSGTIAATSDAASYDSDEWYTPVEYLDAARDVLGGPIELDPASCAVAQKNVQALRYWTKEDDALGRDWASPSFWMNPPFSRGKVERFTAKFIEHVEALDVHQGLVLVNNCTDAEWCQALLRRFWHCFTKRIAFLGPDGKPVRGTRQGQVLFYAGDWTDRFAARFAAFGAIGRPV